MSTLSAIISGIMQLFGASSTNNTGPTGADAVKSAVTELEQLAERTFDAKLGEPDLVSEDEVTYFNEPKIVIPILNSPFESVNRLVFDIPEGREDEASMFLDFLDVFGLDFDSMEDLNGESAPVEFIGGNAGIVWDEITDDAEKGDAAAPHTEETIDETLDEEEDEQDEENTVNVEEEVVTSDA
jgi:hypothetical protein